MKLRFLVLPLVLTLVGAGCQYSSPTTNQPPAQTSKTVTIDEQNKNSTVNVNTGDEVELVLNSTYWTIAPIGSDILVSTSDPVYAPNLAGHIPGSGSGTVTVTYKVVKPGTAQISASRVSCGEALRCTGDQGAYSVTVVAK